MPKQIRHLYRGDRTWILCEEIPEDELARTSRPTATSLPREVDVEIALQTVQAEIPGYDFRVLTRHRPKRDYSPPA